MGRNWIWFSFWTIIGGIIGNPLLVLSRCRSKYSLVFAVTIPFLLFALFQAKFAIITPALITGAFAERIRFWAYMLFMVLFILLYAPLCHMTWHPTDYSSRWEFWILLEEQ
jgi:Amt family ammonium transporter